MAKSSFVQLLHFWGCQIQRKEYTINISVANCSPHQKIQLQVSLTSPPPPKKKTRNPPPKSQLIASSHCRSVLFQTLACWIRFCHRGFSNELCGAFHLLPKLQLSLKSPSLTPFRLRPIQHRRLAFQDPSFLLPRHQHSVFGAIASQALLFQMMP